MRLIVLMSAAALIAGCASKPVERPVIPKDRPADRLVAPPADGTVFRLSQVETDVLRGGAAYVIGSSEHVLTVLPHTNPPEKQAEAEVAPSVAEAIARASDIAAAVAVTEAGAEGLAVALSESDSKSDVGADTDAGASDATPAEAEGDAKADSAASSDATPEVFELGTHPIEEPKVELVRAELSPTARAFSRYCREGRGMTGEDWEIIFQAEEDGMPLPEDCNPPK